MIAVVATHGSAPAGELVLAALRRSTGAAALHLVSSFDRTDADTVVLVDPVGLDKELAAWRKGGARKLVVFGRLPQSLAVELGFAPANSVHADEACCPPAEPRNITTSSAVIQYTALAVCLGGKPWRRGLSRLDFLDEWNLQGYGPVRSDGSIWALGPAVAAPAEIELARIPGHGSFAALAEMPHLSVLWFNRPVGIIDSFEWRMVEHFLAHHRPDELPCVPVLREIPFGYDAAVTMRLDCDEDVASALPLLAHYQHLNVPFSVAITTRLLREDRHRSALVAMHSAACGILSHSETHTHDWGHSLGAAIGEAGSSAAAIAEVTGRRPRYAVSPFHDTPHAALVALMRTGYHGCIGGSVKVNPEFTLARGGILAWMPEDFVGHSQQCMLHGDTQIEAALEAFDLAHETASLFGYLDHPFSDRYQYGWSDEAERAEAHTRLVDHIRIRARNPLFLEEEAAMDFLLWRASARVTMGPDARPHVAVTGHAGPLGLAVEYRGEVLSATALRAAA